MRELFLLALYATRARGDASDELISEGEHEVALRVALAVGRDEAEARVRASERLRELCPPEDGWLNHHVAASAVSREQLRAVFESLSEDSDEEGGAGVTPELIM